MPAAQEVGQVAAHPSANSCINTAPWNMRQHATASATARSSLLCYSTVLEDVTCMCRGFLESARADTETQAVCDTDCKTAAGSVMRKHLGGHMRAA